MGHTPRNTTLAGGVSRLSRTAVYKKRALYKRKHTVVAAAPKKGAETKVKTFNKTEKRTVPVTRAVSIHPPARSPPPPRMSQQ